MNKAIKHDISKRNHLYQQRVYLQNQNNVMATSNSDGLNNFSRVGGNQISPNSHKNARSTEQLTHMPSNGGHQNKNLYNNKYHHPLQMDGESIQPVSSQGTFKTHRDLSNQRDTRDHIRKSYEMRERSSGSLEKRFISSDRVYSDKVFSGLRVDKSQQLIQAQNDFQRIQKNNWTIQQQQTNRESLRQMQNNVGLNRRQNPHQNSSNIINEKPPINQSPPKRQTRQNKLPKHVKNQASVVSERASHVPAAPSSGQDSSPSSEQVNPFAVFQPPHQSKNGPQILRNTRSNKSLSGHHGAHQDTHFDSNVHHPYDHLHQVIGGQPDHPQRHSTGILQNKQKQRSNQNLHSNHNYSNSFQISQQQSQYQSHGNFQSLRVRNQPASEQQPDLAHKYPNQSNTGRDYLARGDHRDHRDHGMREMRSLQPNNRESRKQINHNQQQRIQSNDDRMMEVEGLDRLLKEDQSYRGQGANKMISRRVLHDNFNRKLPASSGNGGSAGGTAGNSNPMLSTIQNSQMMREERAEQFERFHGYKKDGQKQVKEGRRGTGGAVDTQSYRSGTRESRNNQQNTNMVMVEDLYSHKTYRAEQTHVANQISNSLGGVGSKSHRSFKQNQEVQNTPGTNLNSQKNQMESFQSLRGQSHVKNRNKNQQRTQQMFKYPNQGSHTGQIRMIKTSPVQSKGMIQTSQTQDNIDANSNNRLSYASDADGYQNHSSTTATDLDLIKSKTIVNRVQNKFDKFQSYDSTSKNKAETEQTIKASTNLLREKEVPEFIQQHSVDINRHSSNQQQDNSISPLSNHAQNTDMAGTDMSGASKMSEMSKNKLIKTMSSQDSRQKLRPSTNGQNYHNISSPTVQNLQTNINSNQIYNSNYMRIQEQKGTSNQVTSGIHMNIQQYSERRNARQQNFHNAFMKSSSGLQVPDAITAEKFYQSFESLTEDKNKDRQEFGGGGIQSSSHQQLPNDQIEGSQLIGRHNSGKLTTRESRQQSFNHDGRTIQLEKQKELNDQQQQIVQLNKRLVSARNRNIKKPQDSTGGGQNGSKDSINGSQDPFSNQPIKLFHKRKQFNSLNQNSMDSANSAQVPNKRDRILSTRESKEKQNALMDSQSYREPRQMSLNPAEMQKNHTGRKVNGSKRGDDGDEVLLEKPYFKDINSPTTARASSKSNIPSAHLVTQPPQKSKSRQRYPSNNSHANQHDIHNSLSHYQLQQQLELSRKSLQNEMGTGKDRKASQKRKEDKIRVPKVTYTMERFNCITKFAFATSVGYQPCNPNKQNQDTYVLVPNMMGQLGLHLFAVCDGHGTNGHLVSHFIKEKLPQRFQEYVKQSPNGPSEYKDPNKLNLFYSRIPQYFYNSFHKVHQDLHNYRNNFDSALSGSTLCSLVFDRNTVFCANAGDSRAVLFSFSKEDGGMRVQALSDDHKPCLAIEQRRIENMNGRVDTIKGPQGQSLGPSRVWLKDQDLPGLAMSRSLGDFVAHSVGVSTDPEIIRYELQPEHKFIVIASDGVWEFLSNESVGRIVWPFFLKNSPEQAGNALVRAAAKKWRENDTTIDDITCVTIFLEVDHQVPQQFLQNPVLNQPLISPSRPPGQVRKTTIVSEKYLNLQ